MHRLNLLAILLAFGCYIPLAFADKDAPLAPAMVRIPGKNYEIGKFEVT